MDVYEDEGDAPDVACLSVRRTARDLDEWSMR